VSKLSTKKKDLKMIQLDAQTAEEQERTKRTTAEKEDTNYKRGLTSLF
jgi:hypothetical protein